MSSTRLCFFAPELALALDAARLRALFKRFGDGAPAPAAATASGDPLALARVLWGTELPVLLVDALDRVTRLATPAGRDALIEAARDTHNAHDGWDALNPVELAVDLLTHRMPQNHLLDRADLRLARRTPDRATYELRGHAPRPVVSTASLAAALGAAAQSPWSETWVHQAPDGTLRAVLLVTGPAETYATLEGPGGGAPGLDRRRALCAEAFQLLPGEGRLLATPSRPARLADYAAAWGRALYDDDGFFTTSPALTLKPLQALGAQGLTRTAWPKGIRRVRVIACQLDTGDAERLEARGPRAFPKLAPHLRAGGYLTRATFRFDVEGEARPIDAMIEVPNRLSIGAPDASAGTSRGVLLVRSALGALGVLSPGKLADDVTTLLPLVHPEWRWRELVGADGVTAMKAAGVLEEVAGRDTRRIASEPLRRVGRSAVAYLLYPQTPGKDRPANDGDDAYYAVSEDWAIPAVSVQASDMAMLRLRLPAVAAKARRELGLQRGDRSKRAKLPRGVIWVGELRVQSGVVRFFYAVQAAIDERQRTALGKAIARATGFAKAVVFVPRGRKLGRDFLEVELAVREQLGAGSWRPRLGEAVEALGLEDEVPVENLVPEDVRIVVDTRRERVVLDGVPLTALGESGYRLVRVLAARGEGSEPVPARETDRILSGARGTEGATRSTAWRIKAWVKESFDDAGKPVPKDIAEGGLVWSVGRKGWKLAGKGVVR